MEPNHNHYAGEAELPQPQEISGQPQAENISAASPETRGKQAPTNVPPVQQQAMVSVPAMNQTQPTSKLPTNVPSDSSVAAMIADDADLIEKEWVVRAKAIVARTKDDPHTQNREMSKVKADYLKKRYNKDLKISEG